MRRKAQKMLAELVREHMRKTGKNQKEVAREACVTLSVLKNAITEGHNASEEKMRQIAEAVGADWDVLLAEAGGDTPEEQVEVEQLREQVALLEKTAKGIAEERDAETEKRSAAEAEREDMKQRWLQAEKEKDEAAKEAQRAREECDEAVKQMYLVMKECEDTTAALERANVAVQGHKARADAMELELLRLKAGLYDQMVAEREPFAEGMADRSL